MASKKDQLQAYQFMLQRVVSALALQETDPEHPPYRRPLLAAVGSLAIAGVALLAVWVFGLIVPGGNRPFTSTEVVAVEKETGARHVLIDGQLHPVANYSSAVLALDRPAAVRSVSRRSLLGLPRGPRIGIPDAPDTLPEPAQLLTGGWTICTQPGVDDTGARTVGSVLLVGRQPTAGTPLDARALLVRSAGVRYVVFSGHRHEVGPRVDLALDLGREAEVPVAPAWLDSLPRGEPIGPIPVAGAGRESTAVPGLALRVGQLVEVDDSSAGEVPERPRYLVQPRQLQPVTPLQARLQQVAGGAGSPVPVTREEIADATFTAPQPPAAGEAPRSRPEFAAADDPQAPTCAVFDPGGFVPRVVVGAGLEAADRPSPAGAAGDPRVVVPAGRGALVEVVAAPDQPAGQGTVALVTDQGRLFPLSDPEHVRQVLGYDGVAPARVAAPLAARVPRGPALDPAAARLPVPGG